MRRMLAMAMCLGFLGSANAFAQPGGSERAVSRKAAPVRTGQSIKECRNCPELIVLPAGTFMMGSPADEPERRESEVYRKATIARSFAMGKT